MFGVLAGQLLDRKPRGRGDGRHRGVVAPVGRPADKELAGPLARLEPDFDVLFQTQAGRLQNGRNGGADEIVGIDGELGVSARKNRRQPLAAVSMKNDFDHERPV